jgi:fatty acid desaturase
MSGNARNRKRFAMAVKEWLSLFTGMFLASIVVILAVFLVRVVKHARLHHPLACRRSKRMYRAMRSLNNRTTVEAFAPPQTLPVVRSRIAAGAGGYPTTAPAASTHERRAG